MPDRQPTDEQQRHRERQERGSVGVADYCCNTCGWCGSRREVKVDLVDRVPLCTECGEILS